MTVSTEQTDETEVCNTIFESTESNSITYQSSENLIQIDPTLFDSKLGEQLKVYVCQNNYDSTANDVFIFTIIVNIIHYNNMNANDY